MPLLYLLLVFQTGIVLTGAAVRITGSGLGCPTWPECTYGSYVPVAGQAEGAFHAWIEFGNRLLTFLLLFAAVAVVVYAIKKARRDLLWRALLQVLGIFGQGIIGGITVLTDLNPLAVASHFILSIFLIAGAVSIVARGRSPLISIRPTDTKVKILAHVQVLLTFIVIVIGTLVTGSGPHAGDLDAPRLKLDERAITWLHADAVIALLGVSLALLVLSEISPETKRRVKIFFAVTLAQGLVGYAQYVLGLPELLVIVHVLGSTLVWITTWRIWLSITTAERT
jgi:heme a synthase|uniref:COX15/CtaA family protein n=1 Tax=Candidatus Planktophila sp. TaxID=2175601 RepID=UPI00404A0179